MAITGLKFLDGLMDKIPIQGRVERWKNEKDNLTQEKIELERLNLDINRPEDRKKCNRLTYIRNRLPIVTQLLLNKS